MSKNEQELVKILRNLKNAVEEGVSTGRLLDKVDEILQNYPVDEKKRETALKNMANFVAQAKVNLEAAQAIADEWGVDFSFSPAYGMGGTYYGNSGWNSSSQNC